MSDLRKSLSLVPLENDAQWVFGVDHATESPRRGMKRGTECAREMRCCAKAARVSDPSDTFVTVSQSHRRVQHAGHLQMRVKTLRRKLAQGFAQIRLGHAQPSRDITQPEGWTGVSGKDALQHLNRSLTASDGPVRIPDNGRDAESKDQSAKSRERDGNRPHMQRRQRLGTRREGILDRLDQLQGIGRLEARAGGDLTPPRERVDGVATGDRWCDTNQQAVHAAPRFVERSERP
jgi:hypothetical protein